MIAGDDGRVAVAFLAGFTGWTWAFIGWGFNNGWVALAAAFALTTATVAVSRWWL